MRGGVVAGVGPLGLKEAEHENEKEWGGFVEIREPRKHCEKWRRYAEASESDDGGVNAGGHFGGNCIKRIDGARAGKKEADRVVEFSEKEQESGDKKDATDVPPDAEIVEARGEADSENVDEH